MTDALAKREPPQGAHLEEIGVTGLYFAAGQIQEPVQALRDVTGQRGRLLLREMAQEDATFATCLLAVVMVALSAQWTVEAADDSPEAGDYKEFLEQVLFEDMSHTWSAFLGDALTMMVHGFSLFEPVWKRRMGPHPDDPTRDSRFSDGRLGLRKLAPRSQLTVWEWLQDDAGGVQGVVQRPPTGEPIPIPIERLLLFRTAREQGNPEGRSLLVAARRAWAEKRMLGSLEVSGAEKDLTGTPAVGAPREVTEAETAPDPDETKRTRMQAKLRGVRKLLQDLRLGKVAGLLLSTEPYRDGDGKPVGGTKQWDFAQLATPGQKVIDVQKAQESRRTEMAMTFFAQFLLLGSGSRGGSRALSEDQSDFFSTSILYLLGEIRDTCQRHLVAKLWRYNGLPEDKMPRLEHERVGARDLAKLGAYAQSTAAAGVPYADQAAVNFFRTAAGLPELSEEEWRTQKEAELPPEPIPPDPGAPPGGGTDPVPRDGRQPPGKQGAPAKAAAR